MKYEILKEAAPRETISKVKGILKNIGISTKEVLTPYDYKKKYAPRSLRLTIASIDNVGTNGKGNCYVNCKASAYAEFMERVQNLFLPIINIENKDFDTSPDEIQCDLNEILKSHIKKYIPNEDTLKQLCIIAHRFQHKLTMSPWYSIKEKSEVLFPMKLIKCIQGSNGMAAGNTIEEAFVQGMSEICERYALKEVLTKKICMPDIPKEEYQKYDKIKGMIEYIESFGYKVRIKDASLGKKIPVACGIIEDLQNNLFYIKFAGQPNMPVAIERCLTEFAQGIDLRDRSEINNISFSVTKDTEKDSLNLFALIFNSLTAFSCDCDLYKTLHQKMPSYNFDKTAFIESDENMNNSELTSFILKNLSELTGNDIFIRDVSFLGFPSIYIYVPTMSLTRDMNNEKTTFEFEIFKKYFSDEEKNEEFICNLLSLTEEYVEKFGAAQLNLSSQFALEYLLLLYAITQNDDIKIQKYLAMVNIKKCKFNQTFKNIINILQDYYNCKHMNIESAQIWQELSTKYSPELIKYFSTFCKNTTLTVIKNLLYPPILQNSQQSKAPNPYFTEVKRINDALIEAYKNNIPSQIKLKEHIKI